MTDWITEAGFVDCDEARYHADKLCEKPSLSRSVAKLLVDATPAHAWAAHPRLNPNHQEEEKRAYSIGHAAEALILRGETVFVELAFDNFKKKAAQDARDEAYAAGKHPLLSKDVEAVHNMAKVARRQLESHEIGDVFSSGSPQRTLVSFDEGFPIRRRFDWLSLGNVPYEFKTTSGSAAADIWQRRVWDNGLDLQDALYCMGLQEVLGLERRPVMTFIVQEVEPPHAISVHKLSPRAQELADQRIRKAIGIWKACMKSDTWPGYPSYVNHIDAPPWIEQRWEEKQMVARALKDEGSSELERAMLMQAPL